MREELLKTAAEAVETAKKAGASDALVGAGRSRSVKFELRNGKLEKVEDSTSRERSCGSTSTDATPSIRRRTCARSVSPPS